MTKKQTKVQEHTHWEINLCLFTMVVIIVLLFVVNNKVINLESRELKCGYLAQCKDDEIGIPIGFDCLKCVEKDILKNKNYTIKDICEWK